MDSNPADRAHVALQAASAGATVAATSFRTGISVETKTSKTDLVTEADRDAQRAVVARIRESYANEAIVAEEDGGDGRLPESGSFWIVDPIDGTANFVRGVRTFCTAVAGVAGGSTVASALVFPALSDTYVLSDGQALLNGETLSVSDRSDPAICTVSPTLWWNRERREEYSRACRAIVHRFGDLRRVGCAQAELAMVASGALDATLANVVAYPWDTVAGVALVRAAGGVVTDLEGDTWQPDSEGLVASNGEIHDDALDAARAIDAPDGGR